MVMKIYMDNCCLNRPFDDQTDPRVRLESEAVKTILTFFEKEIWDFATSDILKFEIDNTSDEQRRNNLYSIYDLAKINIKLTDSIKNRAKQFEGLGVQAFDAMHLASAENNADIFLTTDDRFVKKAERISDLKTEIYNPLKWLNEVL
ncbi:MAG: PIN domain-containing protein [Pseudomonadales bacterium]